MTPTVGSLFSGIGGLDLGLERAGFEVRWQCEYDAYASRVLAKHWPDVPNFGDVTKVDWREVEHVDVICGGYPCQPFSLAGSRKGEDDERHLWPYFRDALRVLRPRYALLENVPGHLSLGFGSVLSDLAGLGYDCEWDCIPAAAVGAPHLRYRLFVVAYAQDLRRQQPVPAGLARNGRTLLEGRGADVADADCPAWSAAWRPGQAIFGPEAVERLGRCRRSLGEQWAVEPDVCRVPNGLSEGLDGAVSASDGMGAESSARSFDEIVVRVLREHDESASAPHGRGPDEQLASELTDALRAMPHALALGTRQEAVAAALGYLHSLREACEAIGAVRDASLPVSATWQSLPGEAQDWALLGARLGPWHSEWPGVPRVATGIPARVDRLRGLGNAVVPQVAEFIGEQLLAAIGART